MVIHYCPRCKYTTEKKSHLINHLGKKEHCKVVKNGIDVDSVDILNLLKNPLSLIERIELDNELKKLRLQVSSQVNIIKGNHNKIDNSITNNNNVTLVLNLNDTDIDKIENIKGIKDFQDLVRVLHSFEENRNIYKPTVNKDKRIRALIDNGWITYKSLEDIPLYLEKLKDIIDLTVRPDKDDTLNMNDKEIITQVNMGLYDIGKKYKMKD